MNTKVPQVRLSSVATYPILSPYYHHTSIAWTSLRLLVFVSLLVIHVQRPFHYSSQRYERNHDEKIMIILQILLASVLSGVVLYYGYMSPLGYSDNIGVLKPLPTPAPATDATKTSK